MVVCLSRYIRSLPFQEACDQMLSHGGILARGCPDDTLELLIQLATDYTPDNAPLVAGEVLSYCFYKVLSQGSSIDKKLAMRNLRHQGDIPLDIPTSIITVFQ